MLLKKILTCCMAATTLSFAAEYLKNGDFENDEFKPWRVYSGKSTLSIITDTSPAGGSGVLGINLTGEDRKSSVTQALKLGPGKYCFSGYVDTTRLTVPQGYVMLYVSGTKDGKWHNYGGFHAGGTDPKLGWRKAPWKKYEHEFTVPEGGTLTGIWIECISCTGTLMFDNLSLSDDKSAVVAAAPAPKEEALKMSLVPGGVTALFPPSEVPEMTLTIENPAKSERTVSVQYRTIDYFGKEVAASKKEYKLKPGENYTEVLKYPEFSKPGFYCTTANWKCGSLSGTAEGSFVKVMEKPEKPDRLFGISVFAGDNAERFSLMGVGTKGVYFQWKYLEDKNGKLDLTKIKETVKTLKAAGIEVAGHFDAASDGRTPARYLKKKVAPKQDPIEDHEKFYKDYGEFVYQVVTAFKDDIKIWSASGEINLLAYQADYYRQRYINMVKVISKNIRRADKDAKLLALGCSGADGRSKPRYPFLRGLLPEIVDDIDGFGIDQYTAGQSYGEGYVNLNTEQGELRDMMLDALKIAHDNGKQLVGIDEKGPSIIRKTPISSPLGITMANMVARDYIILKTVPEILHWLYFRPDNWDKTSVMDWGMWELANPRQVVSAYCATARMMANVKFVKDFALHNDIPCWIFAKYNRWNKSDDYFAVLWYNGVEPLKFTFNDSVKLYDVQGNRIRIEGQTTVLDSAPQYVIAQDLNALEKVLKTATFEVPLLDGVVETISADKTILAIRNLSGDTVTAKIVDFKSEPAFELPESAKAEMKLVPNETKQIAFKFAPEKCSFVISSGKQEPLKVSGSFKPYRVPRVSSWADVAKATPYALDDPMRQSPGYADLKANKVYNGLDDLSAVARFGYDDANFYMEYIVKDDDHCNEQTPARCFAGDCVQYGFDTKRDARIKFLNGIRGFTDDDYNIVSALASGKPVTYCYAASMENAKQADAQMTPPEVIRNEQAKTTTYRVKLPFAELVPLKPVKGKVFGFSFLAFDYDSAEKKLYLIEATSGITNPTDPSQFLPFIFD